MPLLDATGKISDDPWLVVGPEDDLPPQGDLIIPHERLPVTVSGRLGVTLPNDLDVLSAALPAKDFALIVLNFPTFADGRAYSQARQLRSDLAYTGELRASGHLLPDQLGFMIEVGFSTFDLQTDRFPLERWTEVLEAITLTYHRHLDRSSQRPIIAARHAG